MELPSSLVLKKCSGWRDGCVIFISGFVQECHARGKWEMPRWWVHKAPRTSVIRQTCCPERVNLRPKCVWNGVAVSPLSRVEGTRYRCPGGQAGPVRAGHCPELPLSQNQTSALAPFHSLRVSPARTDLGQGGPGGWGAGTQGATGTGDGSNDWRARD